MTRTTAYFYCNENDLKKNNAISIYRGLLSQILNQCRDLVPYCYDKITSSGEVKLTSPSLAEQLLKLFCEKIAKQYIIIDGLDECEKAQRKLVLSFFLETVDRCDERDPGKLRVLFVSQDYPDIEKALRTTTVFKLTAEDNKKDIMAYVCDWSTKIKKKYTLESNIVEYIQDSTCIRSQGTNEVTHPWTSLMWHRHVPLRKVGHEKFVRPRDARESSERGQYLRVTEWSWRSVSGFDFEKPVSHNPTLV
jgi:hypothetical protein